MSSLEYEAIRIHWRKEILDGKHGEQTRKRLLAMVSVDIPERFCT